MKLQELRAKFRNKYLVRVVAGVLTIAVLGGSMTAVAVQADQTTVVSEAAETTAEEEQEEETELQDLVKLSVSEKDIGKEESVYLISNADGSVRSTIVSVHLSNSDGADTLSDVTSLNDVENVKGDETFTQDGDTLTWQANGNDIYYQGTTDEEAPVTQKLTYYLDGEEIAPEELAGKSGKVTIRFDYTNNSSYEETINGTKQTVKVPFAAVTALVLGDNFQNIEVTNGKLTANGDSSIVLGYALPGISESLGVEESDFTDGLTLPEYFEVTADVENFELDGAMTFVVNAGSTLSMEEGDGSSLDSMVNELADASSQLRDGAGELSDGMKTLQESLSDYADGMQELDSKSGELGTGVETLASSASSLSSGIQKLDKALNTKMTDEEKTAASVAASAAVDEAYDAQSVADQIYASLRYTTDESGNQTDGALYTSLYDGIYRANAAETVYNEVVRQVLLSAAGLSADSTVTADEAAAAITAAYAKAAASDTTAAAMYAVTSGMTSAQLAELLYAKSGAEDTLFAKTESTIEAQLSAGRTNKQVQSGVESSLKTLSTQLAGACKEVAASAAGSAAISGAESAKETIAQQIEQIQSNGYSLVTGASALASGTQTLADSVPTLTAGIQKLNDATVQLVEGVDQLSDGAEELSDGMVEFDEDGIQKLVNSYNGDIKPLADKLQATLDAGEAYQTFTGLSDGTVGSVRFIYKLDSVKADEED